MARSDSLEAAYTEAMKELLFLRKENTLLRRIGMALLNREPKTIEKALDAARPVILQRQLATNKHHQTDRVVRTLAFKREIVALCSE